MFYSQIILAKKGPLGHLWMAAHFQDKKMTRKDIFATDISASVESIVHPAVPLALRVSGHLLLGVVRIYSKKVHYLWQDCHQAMVQIQMAFIPQQPSSRSNRNSDPGIDMEDGGGKEGTRRRRRTRDKDGDGDEEDVMLAAIPATTAIQGFGIPFDLNADDDDDNLNGINNNAEDWIPAELVLDGNGNGNDLDSPTAAAAALGLPSTTKVGSHDRPRKRSLARAAADLTLHSMEEDLLIDGGGGRRSLIATSQEQWTAFDPDDAEEEEQQGDEESRKKRKKHEEEEGPKKRRKHQKEGLDDQGPLQIMTEEDDIPMPPLDDEEEELPPPPQEDQSSLQAEIPRANNESLSSEPATGRPSALLLNQDGGENKPDMSEAEFSISKDVSGIPILDDEEAPVGGGDGRHTSSLNLNQSTASSLKPHDESSAAAVSWGEAGEENNEDSKDKKRKSSNKGRKRKRRKVRANEGDIELTSAEIRTMLENTDDIVNRPPPIGQEDKKKKPPFELKGLTVTNASPLLMNYLSYEQLFDRPALADDGGASPELLELWEQSAKLRDEFRQEQQPVTAALRGEPREPEEVEDDHDDEEVDKRKLRSGPKKQAAGSNSAGGDNSVQEDSVEVARQGQNVDMDALPIPEQDVEDAPIPPQDNDLDTQFLPAEEEEEPPVIPDDDEPPPTEPEAEHLQVDDAAERQRKSSLSLGLVNSLGDDMEWENEEEEDRQEAGEEIVSSSTKWHKHTIKVYSLLKSRMVPPGASVSEEDADKEPYLSYNILSDGCSRRTAVGVFFELLQLKTWDFIELNQDEPYGDIVIAPGAKFAESAPKSSA